MIDALERAAGRPVSRETADLLETYVERLKSANSTQNLVAASTLGATSRLGEAGLAAGCVSNRRRAQIVAHMKLRGTTGWAATAR